MDTLYFHTRTRTRPSERGLLLAKRCRKHDRKSRFDLPTTTKFQTIPWPEQFQRRKSTEQHPNLLIQRKDLDRYHKRRAVRMQSDTWVTWALMKQTSRKQPSTDTFPRFIHMPRKFHRWSISVGYARKYDEFHLHFHVLMSRSHVIEDHSMRSGHEFQH